MTRSSCVAPNEHLFLRLPSGSLKAVECKPNKIIEVSRLGSIPINHLLGRPYYHTYEILEKSEHEQHSRLRIISPLELDAERAAAESSLNESKDALNEPLGEPTTDGIDVVNENGQVLIKNNRLIVDDGNRQALSQDEIEALKKTAGGKEVIEKILANHTALDEKTAFSKAKYTLRKSRKYLKRFTLLPMELGLLIEYILEKEPARILDLREESLALITTWSNAHWAASGEGYTLPDGHRRGAERVLVVDDAGGLLVAALAERKGFLRSDAKVQTNGFPSEQIPATADTMDVDSVAIHTDFAMPEKSNSITLIHSAIQPNVSLLKYFGYDTNLPDHTHPLHTHLKPLSWLQLLHPEDDPLYHKPEQISDEIIQTWKSGKRSTYYKKLRRWERCSSIIDEARAGDFDALVIASHMDPVTILPHTLPLLRGGAHIVVYSASIEPLVRLMDMFSKDRRAAYLGLLAQDPNATPSVEDFPVDPRLLLAPTLQTSRVREHQVLPGRTHPLMTSRGGAEGYVFTARRVIPLQGTVEARGNFGRKRKADVVNQV